MDGFCGVAKSPPQRYGESPTSRIVETQSFRKIIFDSEELIFDYEYLHEFKDKIEKVSDCFVRNLYRTDLYKSKIWSHCHVPLKVLSSEMDPAESRLIR